MEYNPVVKEYFDKLKTGETISKKLKLQFKNEVKKFAGNVADYYDEIFGN